jgi:hypothetical protein
MNILKKQNVGFTQVSNLIINDPKISAKAKGIYAYLYSKPDGWDFSGDRIQKDFSDGRDSIYSGLKELEENGYISRNRLGSGKVEYNVVCRKPNEENPNEEIPQVGKSPIGKIRSISNKERLVIKNNSNKEVSIAETSSAEEDVPDLLQDKQRHIQIIGLWARAKQVEFISKAHQKTYIRRNVRPARELVSYPVGKIIKVMEFLINQNEFKPTLESVGKFIDEPELQNLNKKTNFATI